MATIDANTDREYATLPATMRSVAQSDAKKVYIGYKICCVNEIDSINCTFGIDIKLSYQWNDEKLIGRPAGTIKPEKDEKLFDPELVITNEYELNEISRVLKLTDSATGTVKCSIHLKGRLFMMYDIADCVVFLCSYFLSGLWIFLRFPLTRRICSYA